MGEAVLQDAGSKMVVDGWAESEVERWEELIIGCAI